MSNGLITSEFYKASKDSPIAEYYSVKTRIAAVQGQASDEAYYVWIAAPPGTRAPSRDTHVVEWLPRSGTLRRGKATKNLPISIDKVDGIGFLRPIVQVDDFLMDPSTTIITGGEPPSGPGSHTIVAGRKSLNPDDRTGVDFDLISGNTTVKGPKGTAIKLTENDVHMTKPTTTLEMNNRGWQTENFLADFLPSFPTFPIGMQRLPNLPLMAEMFGKISMVVNAIQSIKKLLK